MLHGILVLDCTDRLGWLAGRLLADLGAEVTKIEAPGARLGGSDWRALNVGKRLARLDLDGPEGRRELDRLAASADIVLATFRPGTPRAELFAHARLAAINARLIVVAVTPFGLTGPKAEWLASDIELMAAGGAMSLAGEPGGTPLRVSAPQSYGWAGAQAAVGALTALAARARTGRGQCVDVSAQAATIVALSHAPAFVDVDGSSPTRAGAFMTGRSVHGARYRVFWPCRDGWINFILYGGVAGRRTNAQLVAWMRACGAPLGALAQVDFGKWDPTLATQAEVDALEAPIAAFFRTVTKREFLDEAHEREMLGYPVFDVADIARDPQLAARGFWQDVPAAGGKSERHCGCFAVVDGARARLAPAAAPEAVAAVEEAESQAEEQGA
jgi:crotonobetainyl-CoA:carnitine CoA-transferase CaiB-like acyl-CoA transferase